jgi:hypothetical protein
VGIKTPKGSDLSGMLVTDKDHQIDIADVDVMATCYLVPAMWN